MKKMMSRFTAAAAAKLKSTAGDTFIEVLAAGLIIVLGIAAAVGMIGASSRIVMNADKAQNDYYAQRNIIEGMDTSHLEDADISISVSLQVGEASPKSIPIKVYTFKDATSGTPVLSYFEKRVTGG